MTYSDLLNDAGQGVVVGNFCINNLYLTFTIFLRMLFNLTSSNNEELTPSVVEFFQWLIILTNKISDLFLVQICLASSTDHWTSLHLSLLD